MAVPGTAVALATAGGVLLYAGLKGESPLKAVREVVSGSPSALSTTSAAAAGPGAGTGVLPTVASAGGGLPQLVDAAWTHATEKYSQARRWQPGYSDCSSFVGKCFKDIGITPPGASVTGSYMSWSKLRKIDISQAGAGDLLCNFTHVVICIDNTHAIGQENPRRNVAVGEFKDLMAGTGSYVCLRYAGAAPASVQTVTLPGGQRLTQG